MQFSHELKILPKYFKLLSFKQKKGDIRHAKEGPFKVGDVIKYREAYYAAPDAHLFYTGNHCLARITHIMDECQGLKVGYVMLSIEVTTRYTKF